MAEGIRPSIRSESGAPPPSPVAALRSLLERTMTVADLGPGPLWTVAPRERPEDAAGTMSALGYDVAGVSGDPITHYVTLDDLLHHEGHVRGVARPILAGDCVERSLPLADLLERLRERDHVFVLDGHRIRSIVTRADLHSPAIGMVVLSLLTAAEAGIKELARQHLRSNLLDLLDEDRRVSAERIFADRSRTNSEIGVEDCLYFGDWLSISARSTELLDMLGYSSRKQFEKATGSFDQVRNDVAHGRSVLDSAGPTRALDRIHRIRDLAERAWSAVETHAPIWETQARSVIRRRDKGRTIIAGPGACPDWRYAEPVHVLTAWNPNGVIAPPGSNQRANRELRAHLLRHGLRSTPAVGESPDGAWSEESYLVTGLERAGAAQIGHRFGQLSVFEIDEQELRVVTCARGHVVATTPRVPAE